MKKLGVKSYGGFGWEKYLQLDSDIQREPLLAYGSVETAQPHPGINYPINYSVPNFGVDSDILDSQQNLFHTEIDLGHDLNLKKGGSLNTGVDDFDGHPANYFIPNFGVDADIL